MLVSKIRRRMKAIIWLIVIAFTVSIFFVGAASFLENWARKDQQGRRSTPEAARSQVDPDFDVRSQKPLAMVRMHGESSVITEGALNRFIVSSALRERLKEVPEQYRSLLTGQLLERMIDEELMVLEGNQAKVNVTPKVLSQLQSLRQKSGSDENFLQQLKLNGWKGVEELKGFMTRNSVVEAMRNSLFSGVEVTDEDVEFYYKINTKNFMAEDGKVKPLEEVKDLILTQLKEQVSEKNLKEYYDSHKARWLQPRKVDLRYLVLDRRSQRVKKEVESSVVEQDLESHYQENQEEFLTPEIVDLSHVLLSKKELRKQIQPEESLLETYYNENKENYLVEEKVRASHILLKTGEVDSGTDNEVLLKISELRKKIKDGEISFEEAAKKHSADVNSAVQGGDLGLFPKGVMVPEFEETAFNSALGEISKPVKTQFGFHLIRADEKQSARTKEFSEVREKVLEEVLDEEVKKKSEILITTIEAALKGNIFTFEELVAKYSHAPSKQSSGVLEGIYLGEGNDESAISELSSGGVGLDYPILITLRTLKQNEVSEMIETADGYHFVKLLKKRDPVVKPLDTVREEIRGIIVENRMAESFEQRKESLKATLSTTNFAQMVGAHSDSENAAAGGLVEGLVLKEDTTMDSYDKVVQLDLGKGEFLDRNVLRSLRYLKTDEVSREAEIDGKVYYFKVEKAYETEAVPYEKVKEEIARAITLKVSEEEIEKYFETNRTQFSTPARVVIQQIAYQKEEDANGQLKQILDGSLSFENAGQSYLNMDRSSFMNNQGAIELATASFDDETRAEVGSLEQGQVFPKLAKSPFGSHIVKMSVKAEANKGSLDEARGQIVQTLKEQKRGEIIESYSTELRNKAEEIVIF